MIPALAPLLTGPLEIFAKTLVLADDPRPAVPGPALCEAATIAPMLDAASREFGDGETGALVSQWMIEYVHVLMPLPVVAGLLLGRRLPVRLGEVALILDDEGMPAALKIPHEGEPIDAQSVFGRLDHIVHGHLAPLIEALAAHGGISPRVLWTNAANLYEAMIREMEKIPFAPEFIAWADGLVTERSWPDGRRNPFYRPVKYTGGGETRERWRRVCCMRYMLAGQEYCSNCPHVLSGARRTADAPA